MELERSESTRTMMKSKASLSNSLIDRKCGQSSSNKLSIVKEKLSDEDFDRLVIDTSNRVARCGLAELSSRSSSSERLNDLCQSASGAQQQYQHEQPSSIIAHNQINQPKRPMNAFMVWGQAIRREFHLRFSNVQNALLSKALGRVWRSLDSSEKEPFIRKASAIKANHKRDYPNYRYQPRRIQVKRRKSSMLIGINFNNPVNQNHLEQTSFTQAAMNINPANSNFYLQASSRDYREVAHETAKHRDAGIRMDRYHCRETTAEQQHELYEQIRHREILRLQIDGVQTYDYQAYAAPQTMLNSNFGCRSGDGFSHELRHQHLAEGDVGGKQQISSQLAMTYPSTSYQEYHHPTEHSLVNETSPVQFHQNQYYECPYEISIAQPVNMTNSGSNSGQYQSAASLSNYDTSSRQYIL